VKAGTSPADIFEEQLEKCGVDYFDFYLLHNLCETAYDFYTDEELGVVEYLLAQKKAGFGKTTLVSEWVAGGERPAAWSCASVVIAGISNVVLPALRPRLRRLWFDDLARYRRFRGALAAKWQECRR
jgi:hypothetical protein